MAGIVGILGTQSDEKLIKQMLTTIFHRGPDNYKFYSKKDQLSAGVISHNLSDMRGSGFAHKGKKAVFFDGEIYNERSPGQTDADVVLEFYRRYDRNFPAYLEGVFACAVFDGNELVLARDAVGVRPLYRGKTKEGKICFASEIKALVGIAEEISELLPSTTFSSEVGITKYLPRLPEVHIPPVAGKAAKILRGYLTNAVARRLLDNAVGACLLSGGLDSSIITAIAHKINPKLVAITVGTKDAPDLINAVMMAKHLGIEHHVYIYDEEQIINNVPQAIWFLESFDEDCVSGAISNLFASSFANKFTKCILSGEGGDELFGGYHLLKDLSTESKRLKMMDRLIEIAYNTALQRLDRAMMGNMINYRTPFIDPEVMAFASQIPVNWKIHDNGNDKLIEKWILREAFKDMLPDEIYAREKLRFSAGTGTDNLIDDLAKEKISENEFIRTSRYTPAGYHLNSLKELWYYNLFKEKFPSPIFEKLVGRWDPNK